MPVKKEHITVDLPATPAMCEAMMANMMDAVVPEMKSAIFTNVVLRFEQSGALNQIMSEAVRQLCLEALKSSSQGIKNTIAELLKGTQGDIRRKCEEAIQAHSSELVEAKLQSSFKDAIAKLETKFMGSAEGIVEQALVDFREAIRDGIDNSIKNGRAHIEREVGAMIPG